MALEKFEVRNRWTNAVQFTAEIEVTPNMFYSVKLGLAVKWGVKARADLAGANLTGADLAGADLAGANLAGADLARANLAGADLAGANLAGAYLTGADLTDADLAGAYLTGADLTDADLAGAYLTGADLAGAYLTGAYLTGAYLTGADLTGAKGAELPIARTRILPDGDLIGWKKCQGGVIVKLRIPEDAPRSHAFGRKCRAKFANVLEVIGADEARSSHDGEFIYRAGERVEASNWCDDWQQECAGGIHFFITRIEAENY